MLQPSSLRNSKLFTFLYLFLTSVSVQARSIRDTPVVYTNSTEKWKGLFQKNDKVDVLNGLDELKTYLHRSKVPSIIVYYASWCGHCQHYAPVYKTFANNTWHWRNVFGVAAIDCGQSSNNEACNAGGVSGFPTIKLYDAYQDIRSES